MTTRDIIVALSTDVFAGSDTTAIALRATIYLFIRNPSKLQKLVGQIDKVDKAGNLCNLVSYKGCWYVSAISGCSNEGSYADVPER